MCQTRKIFEGDGQPASVVTNTVGRGKSRQSVLGIMAALQGRHAANVCHQTPGIMQLCAGGMIIGCGVIAADGHDLCRQFLRLIVDKVCTKRVVHRYQRRAVGGQGLKQPPFKVLVIVKCPVASYDQRQVQQNRHPP